MPHYAPTVILLHLLYCMYSFFPLKTDKEEYHSLIFVHTINFPENEQCLDAKRVILAYSMHLLLAVAKFQVCCLCNVICKYTLWQNMHPRKSHAQQKNQHTLPLWKRNQTENITITTYWYNMILSSNTESHFKKLCYHNSKVPLWAVSTFRSSFINTDWGFNNQCGRNDKAKSQ